MSCIKDFAEELYDAFGDDGVERVCMEAISMCPELDEVAAPAVRVYIEFYIEVFDERPDVFASVLTRVHGEAGPIPPARLVFLAAKEHFEADWEWAMEHFEDRAGYWFE